jgi:DNA-binding protein H-NS
MIKTSKLNALRAKIKELQKQAQQIETQNDKGITEAAELIRRSDLTFADWKRAWSLSKKKVAIPKRGKGKKVPVKYADDKGNKWSGRGRPPLWLVSAQKSGKKRDDFLVKSKNANGASIH